jgi:hypothetical protein
MAEAPVTAPGPGQLLLKTLYLEFSPAQKSWMENVAPYRAPVSIGDVMPGNAAAVVVESGDSGFAPGDLVTGPFGWQEFPTVPASEAVGVPDGVPAASALSVLGVSGKTAYGGLINVGKPRAGDTVLVSGAAGAVGAIVGQIAKIAGCRVIGIAGGPDKCLWLTETVGYDEAIDYRADDFKARLKALCPNGVDIFFDNVGGEILNLALARLARGARVVICGGVARLNMDARDPSKMIEGPRNYFNVVFTGATIQGFLVYDFQDQFPDIVRQLTAWLRTGQLVSHEDIRTGFENAPATLRGIFEGANQGKQMLKVAEAN